MTLSEHRWKMAAQGFGGSEIGAAAGLNPYSSRYDVWEDKVALVHRGDRGDDIGNYHTLRGTFFEDGIRQWLQHETGLKIEGEKDKDGVQVSYCGEDPLCFGTPDGLVWDGDTPIGGVEIKYPETTISDWFEDGQLIVPDHVVCQTNWTATAVRTKHPTVNKTLTCAFIGGRPQWKWVRYDKGLYEGLLSKARELWGLVMSQKAPPIDDSIKCNDFLRRYLKVQSTAMKDVSGLGLEQLQIIEDCLKAWQLSKDSEKTFKAAQNAVMDLLGDSAGVDVSGVGKITWKNNKPLDFTSWKAMATDLLGRLPEDERGKVEAEHSGTKPGARVFRVSPAKT